MLISPAVAEPGLLSSVLQQVYDRAQGIISPELPASTLRMPLTEMARLADVHHDTIARSPESPKVQTRLGKIVGLLADAADLLEGDVARAVLWFRHQPLSGFDGETPEQLVTGGHIEAVRAHLRLLRDGAYA